MPGIGIGIGLGLSRRTPPKVRFDLLENGLDFILEALDAINIKSNNKKLKYGLIHLCSGVELIFKEILRNKDWTLLFQELKHANEEHLRTGNFESVRFRTSISRLESKCSVKFSDEERDIIFDLRKKRNKIEHFKVDESVSALRGLSSKVLNIIIHLIDQKIDIKKASPLSKKYIKILPNELSKFNSYVTERNKKIRPQMEKLISKDFILIQCPNCHQNTLFLEHNLTCLFCNYSNTPEILAAEINKANNEEESIPIEECTKCKSHSLIEHKTETVCLNCINEMHN